MSQWSGLTVEENNIILQVTRLVQRFSMIIPLVETKVKHFISIDSLGPLVCEKGQRNSHHLNLG